MADDMPGCAETIQVFADGSAMEGKVGAAATLIRAGKAPRLLHYDLGPAEEHTVHEAELVGIVLVSHLISTDQKGCTSTAIDVDNQAVLKAFQSGLRHPGQHLIREALRIVNRAQKRRGKKKYTLALRWVAGVEGVDGNELADAEAKRAAQGEHSDTKILPVYLRKKLLINPTRPQRSNRSIIEGLRWCGRKGWRGAERGQRLLGQDEATVQLVVSGTYKSHGSQNQWFVNCQIKQGIRSMNLSVLAISHCDSSFPIS